MLTEAVWDRMSWAQRRQYVRRLQLWERSLQSREERLDGAAAAARTAEVVACLPAVPSTARKPMLESEAVREEARRLHAQLVSDPLPVIVERLQEWVGTGETARLDIWRAIGLGRP